MHIRNGMPAIELGPDGWRKPWSGSNGGVCLEAKKLPGGRVALRQSTDPASPALILEPDHLHRQIRDCAVSICHGSGRWPLVGIVLAGDDRCLEILAGDRHTSSGN